MAEGGRIRRVKPGADMAGEVDRDRLGGRRGVLGSVELGGCRASRFQTHFWPTAQGGPNFFAVCFGF
jgi:hypothetical protein